MNSKICGGFFPQMLFFLACNSVRIGQNLLKEVPGERSILDDFANYLLNVGLNGKLKGSRKDDMRGSIWTKNDQSGRQRVDQSLTLNETKKAQFRSILVLTFFVAHHVPYAFTEALPFQSLPR